MKKILFVLIVLLLNIGLTYGLIYFFVLSRNIVIEANTTLEKNIALPKGTVTFQKGSTLIGNLELQEGFITLGKQSRIEGNIKLVSGGLKINNDASIKGSITIEKGSVTLGENVRIEGDLILKKGELQKHSSAAISGQKPALFITYDWPNVLGYFDVLPDKHKEAAGYIFLTKEDNTSIRSEDMIKPEEYFDGIYYYQEKKLHSIGLHNSSQIQTFFDQAKKFFTDLPERRLGPFSVGATTKTYAHNMAKADIYIPSSGSPATFIHEMGHVLDFKHDFIDHHDPMYPFISAEMAVNSYAATHPGEDFAEAYKYYVVAHNYFEELIKSKPDRQQKYDFLKKYVFEEKEFASP